MLNSIQAWFSVFMLFSASQAVTGIYLLLKEKVKPYANKMLALLFLSWGFSCFWFFAFIQGPPFFSRAVTTFIGPMLSLTLFPPIYLYIKYLFYEYDSFKIKDHFHFLPVYIFIIFTLYLYKEGEFTIAGMRGHSWYHTRTIICSYITMIQGPLYFYATNRILKMRHKKLLEEYSDIEKKKLQWLQIINYSFALIFIIGGVSTIFRTTHINPYYLYLGYHFIMGASLFYITLKIFSVPELFSIKDPHDEDEHFHEYKPVSTESLSDINNDEKQIDVIALKTSNEFVIEPDSGNHIVENLTPSIKDGEIIKKLEKVMLEKKLFKNPNINLHDLAISISETRNSVSTVLNQQLKKTFYDYINELRVEESKVLLSDPKKANYTIEAIAAEAGFKTMSVFYRFFKDIVKTTPTQYRKQISENSQLPD